MHGGLRAGLVGAMLGLTVAAPPAAAADLTIERIDPVVELASGVPIACGMLFGLRSADGTAFAVDLRNSREADGLRVILSADGPITDLALDTGAGPLPALPDQRPRRGRLSRSAMLDPSIGARLFQSAMVGGVTLRIARAGPADTLRIPGPLPQQVRALYLNCAGDLYRQER